jgi:hypothetical protein
LSQWEGYHSRAAAWATAMPHPSQTCRVCHCHPAAKWCATITTSRPPGWLPSCWCCHSRLSDRASGYGLVTAPMSSPVAPAVSFLASAAFDAAAVGLVAVVVVVAIAL